MPTQSKWHGDFSPEFQQYVSDLKIGIAAKNHRDPRNVSIAEVGDYLIDDHQRLREREEIGELSLSEQSVNDRGGIGVPPLVYIVSSGYKVGYQSDIVAKYVETHGWRYRRLQVRDSPTLDGFLCKVSVGRK